MKIHALAAGLVAVLAPAPATALPARSIPAQLVGSWTHNVTQADWDRQGVGNQGFPTGAWRMVIKKNGALDVYTPGAAAPDFSTSISASTRHRFTIHEVPVCASAGRYRWAGGRRLLEVTKVADANCAPRIGLFAGVWKRARPSRPLAVA